MSSSSNGVMAIQEKFLDEGDLFGIKFNQGLVFCEVQGWTQTKYDPYTQYGNVGAGQSTGFERLDDPDGDDILYVENDQLKVKHVAIGHTPAILRRYTNYPEGENRLRAINNLGSPVPGDNYGFVDGEDTPYETPTDAEELFVTPNQHLDFNFFNPDTEAHEVTLKISMREYNIQTLDPNDNVDQNAIRRIIKPGSPMPVVPADSKDRQVDFTLQKFWNVEPITEGRARRVSRGGN